MTRRIRLAAPFQEDSIVDGPGLRAVIWTQGCPHRCPGCHNPQTHDPEGGREVSTDYLISCIDNLKGHDGITFSGGDPMMQPHECSIIAKHAKEKGLNVWCYTGFLYEQLTHPDQQEFLKYIDVLVDGPFIQCFLSYDAKFRGSTNQRLIDVQESLNRKEVVLWIN